LAEVQNLLVQQVQVQDFVQRQLVFLVYDQMQRYLEQHP
jgi:hypothetical protein